MSTPHINAAPGDFADVVLMPGDPLRAQHIADRFLEHPRRVTDVRNMWGFTGGYGGARVSVMAHGIGIPSCSLYATELIRSYGVKRLIRVGSCGALPDEVTLGDVIVAMGASTDSKVNRARYLDHDFAAIPDFGLLERAVAAARRAGVPVRVGNVLSSDFFYTPFDDPAIFARSQKLGILAVEMELAGFYAVAAEHGVRALGILTVSDHIVRKEAMPADARRTSFDAMIQIALEVAAAG